MRRLLLAVVALSLSLPNPSQAYVRESTSTGRGLAWKSSNFPIRFSLDNLTGAPTNAGSTANRDVVIQQFQVWQAAACAQFSVTTTPTSIAHSSARAAADNTNIIYWTNSWTYGSGVLGVTTPYYNNSTGEITEADMQFNAKDWVWKTPTQYSSCTGNGCADTASIALHEEGHFLGLDHSASASAVMYYSWNGSAKRALTNDDVSGICAIYPRTAQGTGQQGAGCVQSSDCISTLTCATPSSGGASICTKSCTGTSDTSCPSGDSCQAKTGGGFACFTAPSSSGGQAMLGDPCGSTECATGLVCAGTTASDAVCYKTCNPAGTNTCSQGQSCYDLGNGVGACADGGSSGGTAGLGEACGNEACASGLICVGASVQDAVCRQQCSGSANCPTGQTCESLSSGNVGACFPGSTSSGTANACQPCSVTSDCLSGLTCVAVSPTSRICRKECASDSSCVNGFSCIPSNASGATDVCSCASDTATVGAGQRCVADKFCKQGLICVDDGSSDGPVCRGTCQPSANSCSAGLVCETFGEKSACVTPAETDQPDAGPPTDIDVRTGGCSTGGASSTGLVLLLAGWLVSRRRRVAA